MKFITRILVLLLACLLLSASALAAASFPDVDEAAPYADAAEYLSEIGVMQGDAQGNFNPDKTVTRAQMAAIICRMLGESDNLATDVNRFTDVAESYWANGYIAKAAELGIIGGYQDGNFKPENAVTYEQAVAMVIRAIGGGEAAIEYGGYPDGFWAVAAEAELTAGIHAEKGEYLARADVAMILYAYYCSIAVL